MDPRVSTVIKSPNTTLSNWDMAFEEEIPLRRTPAVALMLDWMLKILGVISAILFGVWAPISYNATIKGNASNDETQRQLVAEFMKLAMIQKALIEEIKDAKEEIKGVRFGLEEVGKLVAWEFCRRNWEDRACNLAFDKKGLAEALRNLAKQTTEPKPDDRKPIPSANTPPIASELSSLVSVITSDVASLVSSAISNRDPTSTINMPSHISNLAASTAPIVVSEVSGGLAAGLVTLLPETLSSILPPPPSTTAASGSSSSEDMPFSFSRLVDVLADTGTGIVSLTRNPDRTTVCTLCFSSFSGNRTENLGLGDNDTSSLYCGFGNVVNVGALAAMCVVYAYTFPLFNSVSVNFGGLKGFKVTAKKNRRKMKDT